MAALAGWTESDFTHDGFTAPVFRKGTGPGVLVFAEMPGITPKVLAFAERIVGLGCTVVMPSLFGEPGAEPSKLRGVRTLAGACVAKRFAAFAVGETAPVISWCRALARQLHEEVGGPGVGVIGMCFTGGFALAMMVDDVVVAPVLSQPSVPIGVGARRKAALPLSDADLRLVQERSDACPVLGLRFKGDPFVGTKFDTLKSALGQRFIAVELESSDGNPAGPKPVHSVLTEHLIDEPGQPTRAALDQVLDFVRTRLALA